MNAKVKFAAALTALTVATTFALPSSEAQARRWGTGLAVGLVGGALVGAAIANSYAHPVYVGGARRCKFVRQYDINGFYVGTAKVCKFYY
jgi:hypothetical protein